MFLVVTMILSQAEDRATQGCDPSVAWDPRVDGPASPRGAGLFFSGIQLPAILLINLWSNCDKPVWSDSISRFV